MIDWHLKIATVSEMNCTDAWPERHARAKAQKQLIFAQWRSEKPNITLPCEITLTRISPRELDEDNLPPAFKFIRDALASLIIPGLAPGRADGDKRIKWRYAQEKGPLSIRVQIK